MKPTKEELLTEEVLILKSALRTSYDHLNDLIAIATPLLNKKDMIRFRKLLPSRYAQSITWQQEAKDRIKVIKWPELTQEMIDAEDAATCKFCGLMAGVCDEYPKCQELK